jgi:hypothetical protein
VSCAVSLSLVPFVGYELRGEHGELVAFGVGEILEAQHVPASACPTFRDLALRTFGRGGPRNLEEPVFYPSTLGRRGQPMVPPMPGEVEAILERGR